MFVRKKKNSSGSVSIQILQKEHGRNQLVKSIGSAIGVSEIALLVAKANKEVEVLNKQRSICFNRSDFNNEIKGTYMRPL